MHYAAYASPIGRVYVAHDGREPIAIRPAAGPEGQFGPWFQSRFGEPITRCDTLPRSVVDVLEQALNGAGHARPRGLDQLGSFEREVLARVCDIPRGEVRTYGWLAREIGDPRAAKDIGMVLANNPLPLVVPCHRVVRGDGGIGGYNCGGPRAKRALLAREGVAVDALGELAQSYARTSPRRERSDQAPLQRPPQRSIEVAGSTR